MEKKKKIKRKQQISVKYIEKCTQIVWNSLDYFLVFVSFHFIVVDNKRNI